MPAGAWFIDGPLDLRLMFHEHLQPWFRALVQKPMPIFGPPDANENIDFEPIETVEYQLRTYRIGNMDFSFYMLREPEKSDQMLIKALILGFHTQSSLDVLAKSVDKQLPQDFQQNRQRLCKRLAIAWEWFRWRLLISGCNPRDAQKANMLMAATASNRLASGTPKTDDFSAS